MNPDLKNILILIAICLPVGLLIGIMLRKTAPDTCKTYTKSCLNRKWWLLLIGLILFTVLSVVSFVNERPYSGIFFIAFSLLEAFCLVKYGFRSLSPEMEAKIDASDPTQIFPKAQSKQEGESGRREVLTPAPHTTGHTDP